MLHIVFFAQIKEQLACANIDLEWSDALSTVKALQEHLCSRENGQWREVLGQANIICAVNHTVATDNVVLNDCDEIAFFPPVTGG